MDTELEITNLRNKYGQGKPMGDPSLDVERPHFFLHRSFLGDQDLLVILNTKRCRYQCHFCDLPLKSSKRKISSDAIIAQYVYVLNEMRHSLDIIDRITISNEGSVLDTETFPKKALLNIVEGTKSLPNLSTIVLETRLEFVKSDYLNQLMKQNQSLRINVLTGFETLDENIRDTFLGKKETIAQFLRGLDVIDETRVDLTTYVLFKPSPNMTDIEAVQEAEASIDFLVNETTKREIPLTVRINPMYAAMSSKWTQLAKLNPDYSPPSLNDVIDLAQRKKEEGIKIFIGLSTEGLAKEWGSFFARSEYSPKELKRAISFNKGEHIKYGK